MPYTDIYGRSWQFIPDQDARFMLQLTPSEVYSALAVRNYDTGGALAYTSDWAELLDRPEVDCYLLNLDGNGDWVMGVRYGNDPHEYCGLHLSPAVIQIALRHHHYHHPAQESAAVYSLIPRL